MSQNDEKKEMPGLAEQGRNLVNLMKDVERTSLLDRIYL